MRLLAAWVLLLLWPASASAQRGVGELRLHVTDSTGSPMDVGGTLASEATHVLQTFTTGASGAYIAKNLPFGIYTLRLERTGFTPFTTLIDVRSEIPLAYPVTLAVALQTAVTVTASEGRTLLDPYRPGAANYLGADLLRDRPSAAPGRSIIDLVNTQPGWLLEANGVLHARGSEYQVQYVVDGIPFRDNRSPAFAQSLGVDAFESMTVRTAGYPAEYGNKLGGVIEVNTIRDPRQGFPRRRRRAGRRLRDILRILSWPLRHRPHKRWRERGRLPHESLPRPASSRERLEPRSRWRRRGVRRA